LIIPPYFCYLFYAHGEVEGAAADPVTLFAVPGAAAGVRDAERGEKLLPRETPPNVPLDRAAYAASWRGIRVRIGLHYGTAEARFDETTKGFDYFGSTINTCARIESCCHGGRFGGVTPTDHRRRKPRVRDGAAWCFRSAWRGG
jgi:class 3 adenylate cyclase